MASGKTCEHCRAENPSGTMFCMECGEHLEKSDRFTIEKKMEKAHCQACGHYNPIESERCESCHAELGTGQGAVYRDEHGRLRLLRPAASSRRDKVLLGTVILGLLLTVLRTLWASWVASKGRTDLLAADPVFVAGGVYVVVSFLVLVNRGTPLDYKAKALFALALFGAHLLGYQVGLERELWSDLPLDRALLVLHNLALGYCLFFLVYSRFLGSLFTTLFCLLGLWCAYASLVALFHGWAYTRFLGHLGSFMELPFWTTPGFLTFNLFLPYVLLQMVGHFFAQVAVNRRYVVTSETDRAVLREARSRNLRGVFLNLFVAGISLATGLFGLHFLDKPNVFSMFVALARHLLG